MRQAMLIHLLVFSLSMPLKVMAFNYDVDWPTSGKGNHFLAITINGCETRFDIKDKDLSAFREAVDTNRKGIRTEMIVKAIDHANNGCK